MKTNLELNLMTHNCEASELAQFNIQKQLESEVARFPDRTHINLQIAKLEGTYWSFNLSMRYARGHDLIWRPRNFKHGDAGGW